MLRFSYCAVPVGKVPSTGSALTGSRSPLPAIIIAGDALDEVGRVGGHGRQPVPVAVADLDGDATSCSAASAPSTAAIVPLETTSPRLP